MLDIRLIRSDPDAVRKNLERRKDPEKLKWLDEILKIDVKWKKLKVETDGLRQKRNKLSQEVNSLIKAGKKAEAQKIIIEAKKVPAKIEKKEADMNKLREKIDNYLMRIPNLMHEDVPFGTDDSENVEVRKVGKPKDFKFELKNHGELTEELGVADFKRASKISGAGFHYLMGDLARLNQALLQYASDFMVGKGFQLVIPPLMMRREPYEGVVDLSDFENVMYKVEDEDLYMIATSEHPLGAYMMNQTLTEKDLPVSFVGMSPCFRKEIGSHGVDTKGLFRVHQFWKVEMFVFCKPEESWDWHEKMIKYSEELFKGLELPYRVVNICTGDLGSIAAKKYDLEVWMPRQKAYREACSASNCTDYQARRLNIRLDRKGQLEHVHTLNNTALATSRVLVAILENFQNKDGSVTIPKVLRKYMGKQEKIESL